MKFCGNVPSPEAGAKRRLLGAARVLCGAVAGVAVATGLSGAGLALTLEEAARIAVEAHPTVLAAVANKRATEKVIDEARAPYFPTVDGRISSGWERTNSPGTRGRATRFTDKLDNPASLDLLNTNSSLFLRQMIFDGFETKNREAAARVRTNVAGHQIEDAREVIALRAVEAYLTVLRAREVVELAEENVAAHVEVLDDTRLKATEGAGSIADVRQSEARLALARTRLTELRGESRDDVTDFLEAVGTAPQDLELPEAPDDGLPEDAEAMVDSAMEGNPAVRAAVRTVEARRTDVEASKGVYWPRLDIELSAERNQHVEGSRGLVQNYEAFAVARWNFFNGGADIARTRTLNEVASQAIQLEAETRRLVEEQARIDFNAMTVADERIATLEDRVLAADQVVVAYRQQFQLGQRTLLDVLDVENELFQSRVALVNGEVELLVSKYQILSTLGALNSALGIVVPQGVGKGN